jgi:hypothetical protein
MRRKFSVSFGCAGWVLGQTAVIRHWTDTLQADNFYGNIGNQKMICNTLQLKMNKQLFILLLVVVNGLSNLAAQDLQIFDLRYYEKDSIQSFAFVSLSEIYPLSENTDSLAIPDLNEKELEEAPSFEYFKLDSAYRKRFLAATNISETDKVFIYDYSTNALLSFKVKNLNVVACLSIYRSGIDWPYAQDDFMIGFQINKNSLKGFEKYLTNSLAYVGKQNPFARGQVKPVIWKKIEAADYPLMELSAYDTLYAGKCVTGDAYKFETTDLQYFVQDLVRITDNWVSAKRLIVVDINTKEIVCEKLFFSGESASFAPLNNQWTGRLFKNRYPVIFGFQYVSFGCPGITFLNPAEKDIYINCDNRH